MVWACAKNEYRMARGVLMAEVRGGRVRGGPEVTFANKGMLVEPARQCAKDRKEGRALEYICN